MRKTGMNFLKLVLATTIASLLLSGCFSPVKTPNVTSFIIDARPDVIKAKTRSVTLMVLPPETHQAYNTIQMTYTAKPYQIAYFAKNQWIETPSQMLQPLLMRSLRDTHAFRAIVSPPFVGRYDYILSTNIILLQQDFTCAKPTLHIILHAQLINVATNEVIGSKEFNMQEPLPSANAYGGVYAANRATAKLLKALTAFCVGKIRRS